MDKYIKEKIKFIENKMCQAKVPGCSLKPTDIHHMKGRGKYYMDTSTWLAVCRNCHNWIENNPQDAYDEGFSLKRNQ